MWGNTSFVIYKFAYVKIRKFKITVTRKLVHFRPDNSIFNDERLANAEHASKLISGHILNGNRVGRHLSFFQSAMHH